MPCIPIGRCSHQLSAIGSKFNPNEQDVQKRKVGYELCEDATFSIPLADMGHQEVHWDRERKLVDLLVG